MELIKLKEPKTVCWWSGGITSAVACKIATEVYKDCIIVFMDTKNEDSDTYRFKEDCSKWYNQDIHTITALGDKYDSIADIWESYNSLNVAYGAICSTKAKRELRKAFQKINNKLIIRQIFGYEFVSREINRAVSMLLNNPDAKPEFPLLMKGYNKKDCIDIVEASGIKIPDAYSLGFHNNNCLMTGCVQGGIGYWQRFKKMYPDRFNEMAEREHRFTKAKGKPVTMLKDQSAEAYRTGNTLVFLKKNADYPELKSIDDFEERIVKPLVDCNGFCGTNDLVPKNGTENEINYEQDHQLNLF